MRHKPHKKLDAWKKAMELAEIVYRLTARFPDNERYGLVSQMRHAAFSVPANIAEGAVRQSRKELIQYLHIARGSLSELDTFADLAERLGYISSANTPEFAKILESADMLLAGLLRSHTSHISHLTSHETSAPPYGVSVS